MDVCGTEMLNEGSFTHPVSACVFRMRFPHAFSACVANFHELPWLSETKVIYKKSQHSAVNACGNRMCKLSLIDD